MGHQFEAREAGVCSDAKTVQVEMVSVLIIQTVFHVDCGNYSAMGKYPGGSGVMV